MDVRFPDRREFGVKRQRIIPYLYYADGIAAVEYLASTFGFQEREKVVRDDGSLMHAELGYDDNVVMLGSPEGERGGAPNLDDRTHRGSVMCYVDDVDGHCSRSRAAGARITMDLETKPYGERMYGATDPEGHVWFFGSAG